MPIHVRNLEKYHPGYKDRTLSWGKIFINMAEGDPDTEGLCEIDFSRLVKMILLELRAKKPLPVDNFFWVRKGFDLKKRSMSLTLQMLHNFVDVVPDNSKEASPREEKRREEKRREDGVPPTLTQIIDYCKERCNKVDPQRFLDFYTARGWMLNKVRMKDWRAAVRTWEKNEYSKKIDSEPAAFKNFLSKIESDYSSGLLTVEEKNKKIKEWKI